MSVQILDKTSIAVVRSPNQTRAVVRQPARSIRVASAGVQGIQGPAGTNTIYAARVPFAYNDVTILPLYLAQSGDRVARIELALTTAFSDPSSTLSVGDTSNTQRLLTTSQVKPSIAATFESYPLHLYASQTQINLYISPGVSSAGAGIAYVYLA